MSLDRKFYVYVHRRETDDTIFYVGKGRRDRAKDAYGRNRYWVRTANKHGWYHEIMKKDLPEVCSHCIEIIQIFIGRKHKITNITNGGEGVSGLVHSEETKRKMTANRKPGFVGCWLGKKMPDEMKAKFRAAKLGKSQSPEHAQKSRTAKTGKKQPRHAVEIVRAAKSKAVENTAGEVFVSATEAARQMSARLSANCSQGNISMCCAGKRHLAYGYGWRYV